MRHDFSLQPNTKSYESTILKYNIQTTNCTYFNEPWEAPNDYFSMDNFQGI